MNTEKIKEVLSDEKYVQSLLNMQSFEEAQKSLEENDINISVEELRQICELMVKKAKGELTDADLEKVAGGSIVVYGASALLLGGAICVVQFIDRFKKC